MATHRTLAVSAVARTAPAWPRLNPLKRVRPENDSMERKTSRREVADVKDYSTTGVEPRGGGRHCRHTASVCLSGRRRARKSETRISKFETNSNQSKIP